MTGVFPKRAGAALLAATATLSPMTGHAQEQAVTFPTLQVEGDRLKGTNEYLRQDSSSATKTETPVLDTPQAITTITRKQLDDQNPQSVKDALNYTAGVLSTADSTSRYDSVFMRGFGGFGTDTRVVDFLDGLKLPRGQAFALPAVDPFLLDHIDVLKGPSAVLYGQTSPGGLVNQASRAPDVTPYTEVRVEAGNHARLQSGVTSQGALDADGRWQYSISGVGRRSDTRYDNVEEMRVGIAPAIRWQPDADTQLTLQGFYQNDPEGGYFNSIYPRSLAPEAYKSALGRTLNVGDPDFDSYERKQYAIGYSFQHRLNEVVSLRSKTRYSAIDLDFQSLQMSAPVTADGLLPRQALRSIEDVRGVATDNQAQFDFRTGAVSHTALAGVDFQHSRSDWEYQFGLAPSLDVANPRYDVPIGALTTIIDSKQTLRQTGVYLQDQLALGGFRAVLGARYDWTKQETENRLAGSSSSQSSSSPSYRAGLLYRFDSGISPYVSYSTSFEPTVGVDARGAPFEPTKAKQWEAGLKYEPSFMKALFTLSAFHIRQENVKTPDTTVGFYVQQGEVRSRGLEFEARGNVTKSLELIGALTLLDTEVTKSTSATTIGKQPQAAPRYYGSAWANYGFDTGLLDGLTVGGGIRFVGGSFADDANTIRTSGYALVDASVRYDLGKLGPSLRGAEATLNATNLFDKEYYSSCSSSFYCQYGNGAQVLAGLRYRL
ncbi:TonB-dependent siderophore receptor [Azospirillum lipoferum]|uniref:Ferrichrome outer membrane transporter n=1 Tax=Azospirillum lipoferum (strain 4B) TaxID=862719 RepID=G7ZI42_AZOL4|nr:TonB-dependent siderophore receptor [Azospirillum lipoferum]CBS91138.1 ferrichrome outer membrane transporter [Azospirillum lipoferum 4B]